MPALIIGEKQSAISSQLSAQIQTKAQRNAEILLFSAVLCALCGEIFG
jgi:hypothetical protein